jgi:hypothetical protein
LPLTWRSSASRDTVGKTLARRLKELALFALPQRGEDEEQESAISNASLGHIKATTFADLRITTDDKEVKHDHGAINLQAVDAFLRRQTWM